MTFPRTMPFYVGAFVAGATSASAGCANTAPSTGYTPVTGVTIPADSIVAGDGCGERADQVFKYAAVISTPQGVTPVFSTSGVFDCTAQGAFSNLPSPDGGNVTFIVSVFAYNKASFPPALQCGATLPCPGDDAGTVAQWESLANWTATCTVTQIQGVAPVTLCGPLEAPNAGSRMDDSGASDSSADSAADSEAAFANSDAANSDAQDSGAQDSGASE